MFHQAENTENMAEINKEASLAAWEAKIAKDFAISRTAISECKEYLIKRKIAYDDNLIQAMYRRLRLLKDRNNIFFKDMKNPLQLLLCCANHYQKEGMGIAILAYGWLNTAIQAEAVAVVKSLIEDQKIVSFDDRCLKLIKKYKNEELIALAEEPLNKKTNKSASFWISSSIATHIEPLMTVASMDQTDFSESPRV